MDRSVDEVVVALVARRAAGLDGPAGQREVVEIDVDPADLAVVVIPGGGEEAVDRGAGSVGSSICAYVVGIELAHRIVDVVDVAIVPCGDDDVRRQDGDHVGDIRLSTAPNSIVAKSHGSHLGGLSRCRIEGREEDRVGRGEVAIVCGEFQLVDPGLGEGRGGIDCARVGEGHRAGATHLGPSDGHCARRIG